MYSNLAFGGLGYFILSAFGDIGQEDMALYHMLKVPGHIKIPQTISDLRRTFLVGIPHHSYWQGSCLRLP